MQVLECVRLRGIAVSERLACSPPPLRSGFNPRLVSPGFSHVGIVPDDAAGRRVFSGISRFPLPLYSGAAPYSPRCFTLIGSQDLDVRVAKISPLPLFTKYTAFIGEVNAFRPLTSEQQGTYDTRPVTSAAELSSSDGRVNYKTVSRLDCSTGLMALTVARLLQLCDLTGKLRNKWAKPGARSKVKCLHSRRHDEWGICAPQLPKSVLYQAGGDAMTQVHSCSWTALNIEVLRADEGEVRWEWSSAGIRHRHALFPPPGIKPGWLGGMRKYPATLEKYPATLEKYPATLEKYLATLEKYPATLEKYPATLEKYPATLEKYPATLEKYPATLEKYLATLEKYLATLEKYPATLEKYLATPLNTIHRHAFVSMRRRNVLYTRGREMWAEWPELALISTTDRQARVSRMCAVCTTDSHNTFLCATRCVRRRAKGEEAAEPPPPPGPTIQAIPYPRGRLYHSSLHTRVQVEKETRKNTRRGKSGKAVHVHTTAEHTQPDGWSRHVTHPRCASHASALQRGPTALMTLATRPVIICAVSWVTDPCRPIFIPLLQFPLASHHANRVQSPAGSLPDFRMWESWRTMPLVGGFPRGSPFPLALSFRRCSILTPITLIDSQDLAVKSRQNISTHLTYSAILTLSLFIRQTTECDTHASSNAAIMAAWYHEYVKKKRCGSFMYTDVVTLKFVSLPVAAKVFFPAQGSTSRGAVGWCWRLRVRIPGKAWSSPAKLSSIRPGYDTTHEGHKAGNSLSGSGALGDPRLQRQAVTSDFPQALLRFYFQGIPPPRTDIVMTTWRGEQVAPLAIPGYNDKRLLPTFLKPCSGGALGDPRLQRQAVTSDFPQALLRFYFQGIPPPRTDIVMTTWRGEQVAPLAIPGYNDKRLLPTFLKPCSGSTSRVFLRLVQTKLYRLRKLTPNYSPPHSVRTETLHALRIGAMRHYACVLVPPVSPPSLLDLGRAATWFP
ncbi:hypothetical protein PR048_031066 [Dryococelus australis]|uniref:Uncharacterized protein n=1 Tax=Dryococelus australis TaxID=614101 RepID=A0ABQ9G743_9NEOP|nr:hypothetical protein PR048_031066 [Dryococelus australis]